MRVFMLIWEELLVEGMILNLLHIHSFFFIKAGYHGKVIRYLHCFYSHKIFAVTIGFLYVFVLICF